ncbi:hypothetical protein CSB67_0610 [Enterobacter hormaechei]|nr:hypothetical protein CSB67_0610 [Enterobacter hormaechei]
MCCDSIPELFDQGSFRFFFFIQEIIHSRHIIVWIVIEASLCCVVLARN